MTPEFSLRRSTDATDKFSPVYVIDDLNLAHQILANPAFRKTELEWQVVAKLLTDPGDKAKLGSPFAHELPDEDWAQARQITNDVMKLVHSNQEERKEHQSVITSFAENFFPTLFGDQSAVEVNFNHLAQEFSSSYMSCILFGTPDALTPQEQRSLASSLNEAQMEMFALYMLSRNPVSKILALPITSLVQLRFNHVKNHLQALIGSTLDRHPGSFFNQAFDRFVKKNLGSSEVGEAVIPPGARNGQALTLMSAGTETTASQIAYGLRTLGTEPELAEMFWNGTITPKEFANHILAVYAPVDLYRISPTETTTVENQTIPANTILKVKARDLHRAYQDQHQVSPNPNQILTFGAGKRVCAGFAVAKTEVTTFFTNLKQHARGVEYLGNQADSNQDEGSISRRPKTGRVRLLRK